MDNKQNTMDIKANSLGKNYQVEFRLAAINGHPADMQLLWGNANDQQKTVLLDVVKNAFYISSFRGHQAVTEFLWSIATFEQRVTMLLAHAYHRIIYMPPQTTISGYKLVSNDHLAIVQFLRNNTNSELKARIIKHEEYKDSHPALLASIRYNKVSDSFTDNNIEQAKFIAELMNENLLKKEEVRKLLVDSREIEDVCIMNKAGISMEASFKVAKEIASLRSICRDPLNSWKFYRTVGSKKSPIAVPLEVVEHSISFLYDPKYKCISQLFGRNPIPHVEKLVRNLTTKADLATSAISVTLSSSEVDISTRHDVKGMLVGHNPVDSSASVSKGI